MGAGTPFREQLDWEIDVGLVHAVEPSLEETLHSADAVTFDPFVRSRLSDRATRATGVEPT